MSACVIVNAKVEEKTALPFAWEQKRWKFGFCFVELCQLEPVSLAQLICQCKRGEKIIAGDDMSMEPSVISRTTLIPWLTSERSPAALPVYTCSLQA